MRNIQHSRLTRCNEVASRTSSEGRKLECGGESPDIECNGRVQYPVDTLFFVGRRDSCKNLLFRIRYLLRLWKFRRRISRYVQKERKQASLSVSFHERLEVECIHTYCCRSRLTSASVQVNLIFAFRERQNANMVYEKLREYMMFLASIFIPSTFCVTYLATHLVAHWADEFILPSHMHELFINSKLN